MAQDLESLIRPVAVPDTVKKDTWNAYQDATSQDDFVARMNKLSIPDTLKRDLWNLKYGDETHRTPLDIKPLEESPPKEEPETGFQRIKRLTEDFAKRFTVRDLYQTGGGIIGATVSSPTEALNVVPGLGLATNVAGAGLGAAAGGQLYDILFGDPKKVQGFKAIPLDVAVGAVGAGGPMEVITSAVRAPVTDLMVENVSKKLGAQEANATAQAIKTYLGEEFGPYTGPLISRLTGLEPEHAKFAGKALGAIVGYLSERPLWKAASVQARIQAIRLLNNNTVDNAVNVLLTDALQHGSEAGSAAVTPTVKRQGEAGRAAFIERMKEFQKQTGAYPQGRFRPVGQQ